MICSTWSLVDRSRAQSSSMNFIASAGWALHKGNEFAAVDDEEFASAVGDGVGRAGLSVEHRDLAEDFAGPDRC